MRLWRIIATATAVELAVLTFAGGLVALIGGAASGWVDLANHVAPVGLILSALAFALSRAVSPYRTQVAATVLSLAGVALSLVLTLPDGLGAMATALARPVKGAAPLKLVQFNVWDENAEAALAVKILAASGADIVAMEEVDRHTVTELAALKAIYPYRTTCPGTVTCGIDIYSKTAPLAVETLHPAAGDAPDLMALRAVYKARDGRPVTILAVHLVWPMPPKLQALQRAALARLIQPYAAKGGTIFVGDFNLTPWSFALRGLDRDLRPFGRVTHAIATYPATIPRARVAWPLPLLPIDHIYATPDWRATAVHRLPRAGSDHYPVEATFTR